MSRNTVTAQTADSLVNCGRLIATQLTWLTDLAMTNTFIGRLHVVSDEWIQSDAIYHMQAIMYSLVTWF